MMETFAEAWVAANTQTPLTEAAAAAAAADHVSSFFPPRLRYSRWGF